MMALAGVDAIVERQVGAYTERIAKVEAKAAELRAGRDALIVYLRGIGIPVTELAKDTGLTRQGVYAAIRRHKGVSDG